MFDLKAEIPVDPKEEEAVRRFLFSPVSSEVKQAPSTSPERRSRPVDQLDRDLMFWPGGVNIPRGMNPRLVKRQPARS